MDSDRVTSYSATVSSFRLRSFSKMNLPNRNGGSSPPCFLQHFKGRHPGALGTSIGWTSFPAEDSMPISVAANLVEAARTGGSVEVERLIEAAWPDASAKR